ncbi:MAG: DUF814 domain-containing protein [Deltaproteobacteria bacterium]|nr:DUF814 domain-containing protein [Deltaproteobacteria bacterium]
MWCPGGARRLGVGIGQKVVGAGWLPREPVFRAPSRHPLVAALKAHLVGHTVRDAATDDDGALWVTVGNDAPCARVRLFPALLGEARVLDGAGSVVLVWTGPRGRLPFRPEALSDGAALVDASDGLAGELQRAALLAALRAQARRLSRRAEAVREDLARLEDTGRLQRIGRMLLTQGAQVPRGASKATLEDWEEGGALEVTLDPSRPAKAQAERYFHEARRVQRGEGAMRERLRVTEDALAAVRALEARVEGSDAALSEALSGWTEEARGLGLDARRVRARGTKDEPRLPYIEYAAWRGARVLVGRGASDNDRLTTKVARPQDLWLHVRGVPGAHVVVPLDKDVSCPSELLVDAATLAAYHSDARDEDTVEVQYAPRRYVRKPRKSAPGQVVLDREKVLTLRVEKTRLERLLASRKETQ